MKADAWSLDRNSPQGKRAKWRRFVERGLPTFTLFLMVIALVAVVLIPRMVITVPSGEVVIGATVDFTIPAGSPVRFARLRVTGP